MDWLLLHIFLVIGCGWLVWSNNYPKREIKFLWLVIFVISFFDFIAGIIYPETKIPFVISY